VLYRNNVHISGQADSMESVLNKEKKTLPGTPADSLRVRLRYRHGCRRLATRVRLGDTDFCVLVQEY
jgi:hypothetical protein